MISVTEKASTELRSIFSRYTSENAAEAALRVFIQGQCGCGALHYGMTLDEPQDGDERFDVEGIPFVLDAKAAPLLMGAELDFVEELMTRGFRIHNPNVESGCTCGH